MSKKIFEIFKEKFNRHFNEEFILLQGYSKAIDDGLITHEESGEMAKFMMSHTHAKLTMKLLSAEQGEKAKELCENIEAAKKEIYLRERHKHG